MISNEEKEIWHCLLVIKSLSTLRVKSHEKVCKNKYFCGIFLLAQENNASEFNQYMKSD